VRKSSLVVFLVVTLLLVGGGWYGYRLILERREQAIVLAGLPRRPDSSRWSKALVEHIDRAMAEAKCAGQARKALGDLARMYQANGYNGEAETALQALRQLEPQNPRWTYYLADLRLKANDQNQAIDLLRQTARLAPDYTPALILLGDLLIRDHRFTEARPYFESCLAFAPSDPRGPSNLAYLDSVAGDVRGALQRLDALLQKYPNYGAGHHLKGELLAKVGDPGGAAEEKRKERLCPPYAGTDPWVDELYDYCYDSYRLQMAAAALAKRNLINESLPYLRRSVEISPNEPTFYDTLAEAQAMAGKLADARETLQRGVQAVPDAYVLPVHLAVVLCREQRFAEALAVTEKALQEFPDQAEVIAARGHVLLLAQRPAEAVEAFKTALARNNGLPEAHFNLGESLMKLGRADEAKRSFQQAVQIRPTYVDAWLALASIEIDADNLSAAESLASKAFELEPQNPKCRRIMADLQHLRANALAGQGKMEEAEKAYQAGIQYDPGIPLLHAGLGMVYVTTHRLEQALPELRLFTEQSPTDPQAYSLLAHTLAELGQKPEAKQVLEKGVAAAKLVGDHESETALEQFKQSL